MIPSETDSMTYTFQIVKLVESQRKSPVFPYDDIKLILTLHAAHALISINRADRLSVKCTCTYNIPKLRMARTPILVRRCI